MAHYQCVCVCVSHVLPSSGLLSKVKVSSMVATTLDAAAGLAPDLGTTVSLHDSSKGLNWLFVSKFFQHSAHLSLHCPAFLVAVLYT